MRTWRGAYGTQSCHGDAADAAARGGADADAAEKPCAPVAVMSDDSGLVIDALDGAPGI